MKIRRRDFFKISALGAATLAGSAIGASASEHAESDFGDAMGVLVDTTVCIGCRKCEWACNQENKLPSAPLKEFEDRSVYAQHRRPTDKAFMVMNQFTDLEQGKNYTIKIQCMHCNHPACASACIVGALQKDAKGPVTYDAWKCIGCRYCIVACPFQIPAYEYTKALDPKVMKCTFCYERTAVNGEKPACVEICPNEALTFGKRSELLDVARARMTQNPGRYFDHIYGEHEAGGTAWLYLAPVDFARTELPKLPEESIPATTEKIQHGVFKNFVPPLALYGLLGLIMYTQGKNDEKEEEHHERS